MLTRKNFHCDMHMQEFFELNIITHGHGKHYIGDNVVDAETGDVFVIPPMVKHGYSRDDGALDVFHILIGNKFIAKNIAELQKIPSFFHITPPERTFYYEDFVLLPRYNQCTIFFAYAY